MTMLALRSLTLAQFRSHRRTVLELDERPVVLFGRNGAGKTNLLEAVSLFSPGRGLRRAAAEEMARAPDRIGWRLTAEISSLGREHEVETSFRPDSARVVRIDGKAATQSALGRIARILWLVPTMDRLWVEGADGRRRFLDRATLSFEPGHADAVLAYEKAMRERNRLLKEDVRDAHWYAALEDQMARHGAVIHANRQAAIDELSAAQTRGETAFPAADLALIQPDEDMPVTEADLRAALAANRGRDMAAGRTLIGPHRSDLQAVYAVKGVPARDCSTGEQKALLISLILANARALADQIGAPPILLLDEVAAHLDASRRAALYDEIVALGAQAWMTGTGAELFDELGPRAQYFEVVEKDGVSSAGQREKP